MSDDTGSNAGLSAKHALFVTEYMRDRSATQAALRAGYSIRSASGLMALPMIKAEIKRRLALIAVDADADADVGVSLESLIAEAEQAREAAEAAGNASAMVSATKLKADLSGHLDGSQQQVAEQPACTTAETARAFFDLLLQLGYDVTIQKRALGTASVKFVGDDQPLPPTFVDPHQAQRLDAAVAKADAADEDARS